MIQRSHSVKDVMVDFKKSHPHFTNHELRKLGYAQLIALREVELLSSMIQGDKHCCAIALTLISKSSDMLISKAGEMEERVWGTSV